jgi:fumarate reductase subunit D
MTSATLAATTPATRDRYVDLLRVAALAAVILGHWLMAVPIVAGDGSVRVTNLLALVPALRPLTWLFQIMPVFFLVGGFAQATALASTERRGGGYADFARSRAGRLLRPTAVFIGVWLIVAALAGLFGLDHGLVRVALRTVVQPLWFLGVYLGLVAAAPAMWRLHRRLGRWAPAVPLTLLAATAAVDGLRFAGHAPLAYLNLVFVWLGVHQLGFLYADGTLHRYGWPLAGFGLAALIALTTLGPYPVSMVGVPGDRISNMSPPTLALAAHAIWLTGLVLLLREPAGRWLARARVWRAVVAGNGLAMTAFLWHLSAAFVVMGVATARG